MTVPVVDGVLIALGLCEADGVTDGVALCVGVLSWLGLCEVDGVCVAEAVTLDVALLDGV